MSNLTQGIEFCFSWPVSLLFHPYPGGDAMVYSLEFSTQVQSLPLPFVLFDLRNVGSSASVNA